MGRIQTTLTAARMIKVEGQVVQDAIPEGHVRLRLAVGSLCGTDLHYYADFENAGFRLQNPVTLGHEACAWVDDPNGTDLGAGQLVALNPVLSCGECEGCASGQENLCTAKKFPGSATTVPHLDGFFRSVIDHPFRCCRAVADNVDPRHLTFAEPLACALHAINRSQVEKGQRLLVTGCGPMGLLAVAGAAALGADVTAMDLRPDAVKVAMNAGARTGLVAGQFDEADLDKSFDVAVEASGAPAAFNTVLKALKTQGRVSILSFMQPSDTNVLHNLITIKEINVVGSFQFNREFEQAVQLIESGAINLDVLTAATYHLEQVQQALEHVLSGAAYGKVLLLGAD